MVFYNGPPWVILLGRERARGIVKDTGRKFLSAAYPGPLRIGASLDNVSIKWNGIAVKEENGHKKTEKENQ